MAIVSAALFIIMFLSLLLQKIYHCAHDTWWYTLEPINCRMGTAIGASQLSSKFFTRHTPNLKSRSESNPQADATSDILLVILPIQLVREGSVPRDQRILLLSVFSSSILISLISAVHFVFMIEPDAYFQIITAHVEVRHVDLAQIVHSVHALDRTLSNCLRFVGHRHLRLQALAPEGIRFCSGIHRPNVAHCVFYDYCRFEWVRKSRGVAVCRE